MSRKLTVRETKAKHAVLKRSVKEDTTELKACMKAFEKETNLANKNYLRASMEEYMQDVLRLHAHELLMHVQSS